MNRRTTHSILVILFCSRTTTVQDADDVVVLTQVCLWPFFGKISAQNCDVVVWPRKRY